MTNDPGNAPDRRRFFREAISKAVEPLAGYIEKRFDVGSDDLRHRLRPPGALAEPQFVQTCEACGKCVDACPARAIFLHDEPGATAGKTPVIDPDRAACVICEGLLCTHVCPSGALLPLTEPEQIRMGLAEVYTPICSRTNGEKCVVCVELCPLGPAAIRFAGTGPPEVLPDGCTGCGVCQLHCPTSPKAIVVKPI